jgi:putative membrane protein
MAPAGGTTSGLKIAAGQQQQQGIFRVKIFAVLAGIAGLLVTVGIVWHFGFEAVGQSLLAVGWKGFLLVCLSHLAIYLLLGWAWHTILPKRRHTALWTLIWGRLIRDGGSEVLPLSQIGGYVLGARAITLNGVPAATAYASTIVDVTLELLGQLAFTAMGLGLLVWFDPATTLLRPVAIGLAAALVLCVGFVIAQRRGVGIVERLVRRLASQWLPRTVVQTEPVQQAIRDIYENPAGLARGALLHFVAWVAGCAEAWIALWYMGTPIDPAAIIVIESLLYGARSVAFAVPNALGVQEGAYIVLGAIFGLGPETMLALSFIKRGRDYLIGVPALLLWQAIESQRLWRRPAKAPGGNRASTADLR